MLAVMSASEKLAAAQALFVETLLAALPQKAACTVSGAGGGFEAEVSYSAELDLWYAMQAQGKKCWNGFGIGQPVAGKKVLIAAEINFPTEGLNRAVSGVFAEDSNGGVWVLHRGKIRGGKALFFQYYQGETLTADDGGKPDHLRPNRQPERCRFPRKTRRLRAPNPSNQNRRQTRCGIVFRLLLCYEAA